MAAVPSRGRANRIDGAVPPEADLTRALYEQYAAQIFRYCLHQLGSREEAEDAVQSTFLNAFRGIRRGVVPEVESAWLFKIAHNVCLSRRRSSWRRGRIESPTDFDLVEELAPAPSRRADELIGLQDVLEAMPETQRRAILLREWQGLSYREIADELELSQAAVETLLFRARRSLASGLEQPDAAPRPRRRLSAGAFGNLVSSLQSFLFGGGAAVKVAATVAVVSAGTVVATAPVQHHAAKRPPAPHVSAAAPAVHGIVARRAAAPAVVTPVIAHAVAVPATPRHARRAAARLARRVVPPRPPVPVLRTAAPPAGDTPPAQAPVVTQPDQERPTPPGQAKKRQDDGAQAAAHGRAAAPGQWQAPGQRKKEQHQEAEQGSTQQPAADRPPPSTAPPGSDPAAANGRATAPGQEKKRDSPVSPPAAVTNVAADLTATVPGAPTGGTGESLSGDASTGDGTDP